MKILLVNHGRAGEYGGGDGVQVRETAKRLLQRGHQVVAINSDTPDPREFDLVHIFNCRVHQSFKQQIAACQAAEKPVVVSPIWVSIPEVMWGSHCSFAVVNALIKDPGPASNDRLEKLKQRNLAVTLRNGTISADGSGTVDLNWINEVGELFRQVDGLLPNSWLELKAMQHDLHWCGDNFEIAHYGVDPSVFLDAEPGPFRENTGIQGPFVVQAGRIEPAKNQLMLCLALQQSSLPLVLIGSSSKWPSYAESCRKLLGDRLTIIDHIPQPLLASAFAASAVHVLPSWMETCGLVTLEAALSGAPVVGSSFGHELEYLRGDCWWCDPADPASIRRAVEAAWQAGRTDERPIRLKRRILEEFNWERTTDATERLYKRVLRQRTRSYTPTDEQIYNKP